MTEFDFGHAYEVTAHSLLLFIFRPCRTRKRATDTERSFQHVIQAPEDASVRQLVPGGRKIRDPRRWERLAEGFPMGR
ncbi:hypothetical protein [Microvirga zambiensis]|uniref:hypothetical protein n=1 Tax=Microvirga zambiensis TaxID=1402137 RepID=UPI00191E14A3|nr:hypothetical protein [Microvirga zambiensis]